MPANVVILAVLAAIGMIGIAVWAARRSEMQRANSAAGDRRASGDGGYLPVFADSGGSSHCGDAGGGADGGGCGDGGGGGGD